MFKSFKIGFNSMWPKEFQVYKLNLEKAEEPEIKLTAFTGSWLLDHRESKAILKNINFCFVEYAQTFDYRDCNKLSNILKEIGTPDYFTCLMRNLYVGQEATLGLDMKQWAGSKFGKEYVRVVYCHIACLPYRQSILYEMLEWMAHKLESRLLREISTNMQMI